MLAAGSKVAIQFVLRRGYYHSEACSVIEPMNEGNPISTPSTSRKCQSPAGGKSGGLKSPLTRLQQGQWSQRLSKASTRVEPHSWQECSVLFII